MNIKKELIKGKSMLNSFDMIKGIFGVERNKLTGLNDSHRQLIKIIDEIKEMEEKELQQMKPGPSKDFNILYKKLPDLVDDQIFLTEHMKRIIGRSRVIRNTHKELRKLAKESKK